MVEWHLGCSTTFYRDAVALENCGRELAIRMALRAKLPWTVIVGSDPTRAYKPTLEA